MLYHAYQAHADFMGPVRVLAGIAAHAIGHPEVGASGQGAVRNLTAAYELIARAGLTHKRPAFGIDRVDGRKPRGCGAARSGRTLRRSARSCASEGHRRRRSRGSCSLPRYRGISRRSARHRAHDAARARRVHHRLAQRARRRTRARPLRLRRLHRAPHPVPRGDGTGRACDRGMPALRRGARRRGRDGAGRPPGAAAQHDA